MVFNVILLSLLNEWYEGFVVSIVINDTQMKLNGGDQMRRAL
jgi:hypothetical protein